MERRHLSLAKELASAFGPAAQLETTADLAQISLGGDDEGTVVYLFLPETVEIRHRMASWPLPYAPVMTTRTWRRMRLEDANVSELVSAWVEARKAWKRMLRRCCHCRELLSPGHLMRLGGKTMCHGCATEHHGVVF
jgi:hypothetical protein